jgi:hypothetical protein
MIAALATLVFLSTLWMLIVVGAHSLGAGGAKILSALKGHSLAPTLATPPTRLRHQRFVAQRAAPVSVRQRAAA